MVKDLYTAFYWIEQSGPNQYRFRSSFNGSIGPWRISCEDATADAVQHTTLLLNAYPGLQEAIDRASGNRI